jgi:hypothetical protein
VAHHDRKTFQLAGCQLDSEGLAKFVFREPQATSSLTSRGNQPMFFPGLAIVVEIISDSRAPRDSICPYKENEPFAVQ